MLKLKTQISLQTGHTPAENCKNPYELDRASDVFGRINLDTGLKIASGGNGMLLFFCKLDGKAACFRLKTELNLGDKTMTSVFYILFF